MPSSERPSVPPADSSDELCEFFACAAPMWIYDQATLQILEVNPAAVASYGYSRNEFLKMTILDIRPAADVREVMRSALEEHPTTGHVWRHQKRDGTIIRVRVTSAEIEYLGRVARMVNAFQITPDAEPARDVAPVPLQGRAKTGVTPRT